MPTDNANEQNDIHHLYLRASNENTPTHLDDAVMKLAREALSEENIATQDESVSESAEPAQSGGETLQAPQSTEEKTEEATVVATPEFGHEPNMGIDSDSTTADTGALVLEIEPPNLPASSVEVEVEIHTDWRRWKTPLAAAAGLLLALGFGINFFLPDTPQVSALRQSAKPAASSTSAAAEKRENDSSKIASARNTYSALKDMSAVSRRRGDEIAKAAADVAAPASPAGYAKQELSPSAESTATDSTIMEQPPADNASVAALDYPPASASDKSGDETEGSATRLTESIPEDQHLVSSAFTGETKAAKNLRSDTAQPAIGASNHDEQETIEEPAPALSPDGYTIQLGAYSSAEKAEQGLKMLDISPELIRLYPALHDGKPIFLLLYGDYTDLASAKAAGSQLTSSHPDIAIWVRSNRSIPASAQ